MKESPKRAPTESPTKRNMISLSFLSEKNIVNVPINEIKLTIRILINIWISIYFLKKLLDISLSIFHFSFSLKKIK